MIAAARQPDPPRKGTFVTDAPTDATLSDDAILALAALLIEVLALEDATPIEAPEVRTPRGAKQCC